MQPQGGNWMDDAVVVKVMMLVEEDRILEDDGSKRYVVISVEVPAFERRQPACSNG